MSEIKSHEFDNFLQRSAAGYRLFLLYGPDRGLVSERATALAETFGIPLDDPFAVVKMDATGLQGAGSLLDEVNAIGLFGGEKLVWMRGASTEKALIDALQFLASDPPVGARLIVEAGDLKKGAALRKVGESSRSVASIACYSDDARGLQALIDKELSDAGLRISPAGRERLMDALGGDRMASRNELRKLALYCLGKDMVDEVDVLGIVGDASAISVDDAVDAVLKGDPDALLHAMKKITTSKTPPFLVLQACLRQFQQLDVMRAEMDANRQPPAQVVATLGRGLHFRRKPVVEAALKHWTTPAIRRELSRLQSTIYQSRSRQSLEESLVIQNLLAITIQSARR
ncbi:DNA polymerase III subunit delta [Sinorhizobium medicae]|uniref:DNA-directed DNA polymerase n=1 Tax=Sinorhizobium medicae TaxID=110321 RepID=A0A6G1WPP9_9HYPH|nr:DNA polymerase III subunit delta [Sinorhizobium medicae]MQV99643.1 DNA polymerase III subunit delta [Sinorhizobium medicae]MQW71740.1 DNA polymerase III subunit delta [Sinorhizobium medicae]MQX48549.1 DNA polymerase III subunit delta [Sinorhizobium medicae]MQX84936.1 DNA polymerase III subunit delta [Sinorhizobium medicae]RVJ84893.1 DNA polymerase III subunit delta [Sinorhizobium medicae]